MHEGGGGGVKREYVEWLGGKSSKLGKDVWSSFYETFRYFEGIS